MRAEAMTGVERGIRVQGKKGGMWALIGRTSAATYIPPSADHHEVLHRLGIKEAQTVMGHLTAVARVKESTGSV